MDETFGRTPLHNAVLDGDIEAINSLIADNKNDINAQTTETGATPLMYAASEGNIEAVEILLSNKADVGRVDKVGQTALHYAVMGLISVQEVLDSGELSEAKKRCEIMRKLFSKGANPWAKDNAKQTALHIIAHESGHPEIIQYLVNIHKLTVDVQDENNRTPLMHAVRYGKYVAVKELIHCDANVKAVDKYGVSVLDYATQREEGKHKEDIVKDLQEKGAVQSTQMKRRENLPSFWAREKNEDDNGTPKNTGNISNAYKPHK